MSIFGIAGNLGSDPKKILPETEVQKERLAQYFNQLSAKKDDTKLLFDLMAPKNNMIAYKRYQDVM